MKNSKNNFKFKHSLGQNFLTDEFILEDIADDSKISGDDFVLEIGPGNGALTRCLCDRAKHVVSVEIDKTLIPLLKSNLKEYNNISIINADFLKYDFNLIISEFSKYGFNTSINHIKVVANLPYYITSPIIMNILLNPYISEMTIMVQKEVANRIVAIPSTKDFGVLTLSCNYFSETELLFIVTKECFFPQPKVDSAVVRFIKKPETIDLSNPICFHLDEDENYKKLFNIIKISFQQRRKTLVNSLLNSKCFNKNKILDAFNFLNFSPLIRAENLSLNDYIKLTKILENF